MRKWIIGLILMLCMVSTATALEEICQDTREINQNCTMVTPIISCMNYNYSIINIRNGNIVDANDLTQLSGSLYYFNFTQPEGDYVIRLCDDTTREVRVIEEDNTKMIIGVIILLPMLLAFIFMMAAKSLGEQHNVLKIFLFLLCMPLFYTSFHYGMIGIIKFYNLVELQDALGTTTYWLSWIYFVIISYFLIYAISVMFHTMAQKKKEKMEY